MASDVGNRLKSFGTAHGERSHEWARATASGHEGQFEPPRVSGRSAFREETFAGRCGNEKNAPTTWSAVCYLAAASKLPDSSGAATG
jgi:hypothetical protein